MRVKKQEVKVKPKFRISEDYIDLRTLDTNVIVEHLEYNLKLRELPVEKRIAEKIKNREG